jgi:hypothetical protein
MASERSSLIATLVGGGLTLVTAAAAGLGASSDIWIGAAVAGLASFAAAAWLHVRSKAKVPPKAARVIPAQHLDDLRKRLACLAAQVERSEVCDYRDPPGRRQFNREEIANHFPKLAAKLGEWDQAILCKAKAQQVLRERLHQAAERIGVGLLDYDVKGISKVLVDTQAHASTPSEQRALSDSGWRLSAAGRGSYLATMNGEVVATMSGPTARLAQDEFAHFLARVKNVRAQVSAWDEAQTLRDAERRLQELHEGELVDELRAAQYRHEIPVSFGCPACAGVFSDTATTSVDTIGGRPGQAEQAEP